ncbi:sodium:proton antiporter, partial [Bacillus sp. SIMBA_161]
LYDMDKNVLLVDDSWGRLQKARQIGIKTYVGNILSEHTEYEVDLTPYEKMIVASETDSFNALVVNNFVPEMGRINLYQTALH